MNNKRVLKNILLPLLLFLNIVFIFSWGHSNYAIKKNTELYQQGQRKILDSSIGSYTTSYMQKGLEVFSENIVKAAKIFKTLTYVLPFSVSILFVLLIILKFSSIHYLHFICYISFSFAIFYATWQGSVYLDHNEFGLSNDLSEYYFWDSLGWLFWIRYLFLFAFFGTAPNKEQRAIDNNLYIIWTLANFYLVLELILILILIILIYIIGDFPFFVHFP